MTPPEVDAAIRNLEAWGRKVDNWELLCAAAVGLFLMLEVIFSVLHWINERHLRPLRAQQAQFHETELGELRKATAEANDRAKQAELALEKYKAPRSFTLDQLASIKATATKFPGTSLHIFIASSTIDARSLADALSAVLTASKWSVGIWNWIGVGPISGSRLYFKPEIDTKIILVAQALSAVLGSTDLHTDLSPWPGDWGKFGGMLNGPQFDSKGANLRLVIGSKPQ